MKFVSVYVVITLRFTAERRDTVPMELLKATIINPARSASESGYRQSNTVSASFDFPFNYHTTGNEKYQGPYRFNVRRPAPMSSI